MKKQAYNPFLPLNVCIPDGEPHVFGNRVYLFGSHDKQGGETFCMLDYEVWSAPVDDLSDWSTPGVSFSPRQDPLYSDEMKYCFAPDVVQGNDGRFYLYYCMAGKKGEGGYRNPISVAVCDTPDGKYEYLGVVKTADGKPLMRYVCFDPAVINDNGVVRLYYGTCYPFDEHNNFLTKGISAKIQSQMFGRTKEEILKTPGGIMGAVTVTLADDMMTAVTEPIRIIPTDSRKTSFDGHAFYEGSSIRKIGDTYYFVYSSFNNHELCYATSKNPDSGFVYGGTIVSNGDIGLNGREPKDRLNATGTNHGSIECVNGQWYVFYHRLTHKSDYSRQACAQPITIAEDGSIAQAEITSCGLNGGALSGIGAYPAVICCNLTNGKMPHGTNKAQKKAIPHVTHQEDVQFITEIGNRTVIGYKYFDLTKTRKLSVNVRGQADGTLAVRTKWDGAALAEMAIHSSDDWQEITTILPELNGVKPLYFMFTGKGMLDMRSFTLEK